MSAAREGSLSAVIRAAVAAEIASELRHDLRNHLAAIRNAGFYLRRRAQGTSLWAEDPRIPTFFGLIESETQRADERLVDTTPRQRQGRVRVGLAIMRAIDDLAPEIPAGVALRRELPPELVIVGSEDDLALAVRMVLENAIEAVGGAGEVEIVARAIEAALEIEIRDSGPGIADPERARAARHTTKPGHLGFGLPIATRALRRQGGELEIAVVERGTCVRLRAPLENAARRLLGEEVGR